MVRSDFVAGIDFGGTKVAIATAALDGEVLARQRLDTQAELGAEQTVMRTIKAAQSMLVSAERDSGGRCLATGVVSPGVVRSDRIDLAPNVPGWEQLMLERQMRAGLGVDHVVVGNDAKAAGLAEARWGALAGADPGLYLSLGTGVSAAVFIGGRVLEGAHGAAGEIGYSLLGPDDPGAFAGGQAPLEELAGGRFIGLRASALVGRQISTAEAFAAQDPPTRGLVDRTLDELAVHVSNLSLLVDPERIAVGGGMMASSDRVLDALDRRLARALPFPPRVVCAHFLHDAALRGALALAVDTARGEAPKIDPYPGGSEAFSR